MKSSRRQAAAKRRCASCTGLERAYRTHSYLLRIVTVEQGYAPLRSDPRYADLLRRMALP